MRVLIATATGPKNEGSFEQLTKQMRASAAEGNLTIPPGIWWTGGRGCSNLAFDVVGPDDEAERFANALTMAFMPSKWCTTSDSLPDVDTCDLDPVGEKS